MSPPSRASLPPLTPSHPSRLSQSPGLSSLKHMKTLDFLKKGGLEQNPLEGARIHTHAHAHTHTHTQSRSSSWPSRVAPSLMFITQLNSCLSLVTFGQVESLPLEIRENASIVFDKFFSSLKTLCETTFLLLGSLQLPLDFVSTDLSRQPHNAVGKMFGLMGIFFTSELKVLNFSHCNPPHPAPTPFYGGDAETQRASRYLVGNEQNIYS